MDDSEHKFIKRKQLRPESLMMSYGYRPEWSEGAAKIPIFQTSTFVFESAEDGKAFFESALGKGSDKPSGKLGLIYSRLKHPFLEFCSAPDNWEYYSCIHRHRYDGILLDTI